MSILCIELEKCPSEDLSVRSTPRYFVSSHKGLLYFWNRTGKLERIIDAKGSSLLEANKAIVVSAHADIFLWDSTTGVCLQELKGHTDTVTGIILHNNITLISKSNDRTVRIWDTETGACKFVLGHGPKSETPSGKPAYDPLGQSWQAGDLIVIQPRPLDYLLMRAWNISSGSAVDFAATAVACSNMHPFFFTLSPRYPTIEMWEISSLTCVRTITTRPASNIFLYGEDLIVTDYNWIGVLDANTGEWKTPCTMSSKEMATVVGTTTDNFITATRSCLQVIINNKI